MSNAPDPSVQLQQTLSQARELLKAGGTTLQIERVLSPFEQMFESPHRSSQCAHFVIHNLDICEDEIVFQLATMAIQEQLCESAIEVVARAYSKLESNMRKDKCNDARILSYLTIIERDVRVVWTDGHICHLSLLLDCGDEPLMFAVMRILVCWQEQFGYLPASTLASLRRLVSVSPRCDELINYGITYCMRRQ